MNSSRYSVVSRAPLFSRNLVVAAALTFVALCHAPVSAEAQSSAESTATTVTSKQKVTVIIDRERATNQTFLLLKITVPEDAQVESFPLTDPARIVVDFKGVKIKTSENLVPPKNGVLKMIRLGAHADKLRVVLDLSTTDAPQYDWRAGARQATLRITESTQASAAPQATKEQAEVAKTPEVTAPESIAQKQPPTSQTTPQISPQQAAPPALTPAPTSAGTPIPTSKPTVVPTKAPTKAPPTLTPTSLPSLTPTRQPSLTPTTAPTKMPSPPPTTISTPPPAQPESIGVSKTEPKLPDLSDKELEEALDKEVAKATEALERGESLPENLEFEGEDLVDVPAEDGEDLDLSEEKQPATAEKDSAENKSAALITKDLPTTATNQAPVKSDPAGGLRANSIPAPPVTDFTVQSAEYSFLEPDHKEAFRVSLSKPGAQAQMSKVDPTTYKVVIQRCGLANLGLALPQYPPADFKGILAVTPKIEGDTVEITAQVEQGASLTTLIRDREVWIKIR